MGTTVFQSRGIVYTHTNRMVTETCYKCHVMFGMTEEHHNLCLERGCEFFCPNGHGQIFTESKEQKLEKELRQVRQNRDTQAAWYQREVESHKKTKAQRRGYKSVVTRNKRRIANGVCPCCNRTFKQLARHMKTQHPEYVETAVEAKPESE